MFLLFVNYALSLTLKVIERFCVFDIVVHHLANFIHLASVGGELGKGQVAVFL